MLRTVPEAVLTAMRTASLNEVGELPTSSMTRTTPAGSCSAIGAPFSGGGAGPSLGHADGVQQVELAPQLGGQVRAGRAGRAELAQAAAGDPALDQQAGAVAERAHQ